MKKNALSIVALMAALLGLSACNDLSSPESTLASAATAVQKGDLKDLRGTLSDKALATYGTKEGLAALSKDLMGMEFKTDGKKYVGGISHGYWKKTYVYTLDVMVRAKGTKDYSKFKTANVACDWRRGRRIHHPHHGGRYGNDWSNDWETETPDSTTCQITDLN